MIVPLHDAVWLYPVATVLHVREEWPGFPGWARRFASTRYTDREYVAVHAATIGARRRVGGRRGARAAAGGRLRVPGLGVRPGRRVERRLPHGRDPVVARLLPGGRDGNRPL